MSQTPGAPLKKQRIAEHLRNRIVRGELGPGERLPTRLEIEQQFGASTVTVQGALDSLVAGEFVRTSGRGGTFVVENPPHLSRYALVFRHHPRRDARMWTRFETVLCDEAARLLHSGERQIRVHTGIEAHTDNEGFQNLVQEVRQHRLAGLIFLAPDDYEGTALLGESGIARVAVGVNMVVRPGIHAVSLDLNSFWEQAFDFLAARGRKRVAMVRTEATDEAPLIAAAQKRGLEVRPYWMQTVGLHLGSAARSCVHLLMHAGQNERPDALIISDDNLLGAATQGLLDAGVRVPDEVEVVSHCNFPHPSPGVVPVQRLGFDIHHILQLCLENIDQQRQNETTESLTRVKARFEAGK